MFGLHLKERYTGIHQTGERNTQKSMKKRGSPEEVHERKYKYLSTSGAHGVKEERKLRKVERAGASLRRFFCVSLINFTHIL